MNTSEMAGLLLAIKATPEQRATALEYIKSRTELCCAMRDAAHTYWTKAASRAAPRLLKRTIRED